MEMRVQAVPPAKVICGTAKVPFGKVLVGMTPEGEVCRVSFMQNREIGDMVHSWQLEWPASRFSKGVIPKNFATLPLVEVGNEFQRKVWLEIMRIPHGEVLTYGQIAEMVEMPGRARAVGRTCKMSHLAFVVPCHRVIAANGLGGFGSDGTALKEALLKAEGVVVRRK